MGSSSEGHGKRRRRSSRVCRYCQRRKVRCDFTDRGSPCTNCSYFGVECVAATKGNYLSSRAFLTKWKDVEVEALFKSIATYENYDRESKGETVNLQNRIISPSPIMNEWAFGYLIDEPRPAFIKTSSAHLEDCEMQYLRVKGALSIPKEEFRRDLLRAFIRRVYYVFPMVNIFDFLSAIVLDDGRHPISLLLFQAVMLSAIPYINIDRLVVEGFCSRKQAQDVFLQRVMALYNVGYETEQLPMIQASFLLSLTDDPVAVKDSWYWLGTSLSFAQAVNFHLDTPGYCKGEKGLPRRIWWSIFTQDKILALSMKYPCRIRDDTYQVPMLVLDDFELHRADPAIHSIVGQDMRIQDTEYQKKLALITIQTATMSVVIGEILMLQYIPSLRASSNGELPSITVIPRRTATRQDIRLYESKLALCMKFQNAESQWNGAEANRHLGTSEGETLLLIQAETSLMHLTTLMALYRPQVRPAQSATSIGSDLQVYSQHQAKSVATEILEICNILKENGLLPQLSHTTVLSVYQAALIHLSFLNSADAVEQMLGFNKFDQLVRLLKDMDDIHITAKLGASLLHSIVQKAAFV